MNYFETLIINLFEVAIFDWYKVEVSFDFLNIKESSVEHWVLDWFRTRRLEFGEIQNFCNAWGNPYQQLQRIRLSDYFSSTILALNCCLFVRSSDFCFWKDSELKVEPYPLWSHCSCSTLFVCISMVSRVSLIFPHAENNCQKLSFWEHKALFELHVVFQFYFKIYNSIRQHDRTFLLFLQIHNSKLDHFAGMLIESDHLFWVHHVEFTRVYWIKLFNY